MRETTQTLPPPVSEPPADLIVAAGRGRTALVSGFLAGLCIFFAPLVVLAVALLATYLGEVVSDGTSILFGSGRPLRADDFRAVFAPAIDEAPLLGAFGLLGAALALARRSLAMRGDPGLLAAGRRPLFPEYALLYMLLGVLGLLAAAVHGGMAQLTRLLGAAPIFLLFLLCITWLAHSVWSYCFANILTLLASRTERDAALALRARARLLPHAKSHR